MSDDVRQETIEGADQVDSGLDRSMDTATERFIEQRSYSDFEHDRLDQALSALGAGITRLERKLDRILALVVESRRGSR